MGGALAYIGYKTRSVYVPFVAHYTFNLLTLGAGLLAAHFLLPMARTDLHDDAGPGERGFLYYNFRSNKKARAHERKAQRKADLLARAGKVGLAIVLPAGSGGRLDGRTGLRQQELQPGRLHESRAGLARPGRGQSR